jgi:ribosomal protein L37AE/L43A
MPIFTCSYSDCGLKSAFRKRKTINILEMSAEFDQETRTYECEHCGRQSVVRMTKAEWKAIDGLGSGNV